MSFNFKASLLVVLLITVYTMSQFHYRMWDKAVLGGGDPWGYYAYLPAAFIHHDLDSLHRTVAVRKAYQPASLNYQDTPLGIGEAHPVGDGKHVIKYTMGIALLEAPFFAMAHALASPFGFPTDGFSKPYILALHLAAFCYTFLGLFVLWRMLRRFFTENIALLTVSVIALATNLYYFTVYNSPMAHAFMFCLHSLVLYGTARWYGPNYLSHAFPSPEIITPRNHLPPEKPRLRFAVLTGLCCGLITLIRPTEVIVLVIPLLYGLNSFSAFKSRLSFWRKHGGQVAAAALVFMLAGIPQMLYWKWTSGHFLFYSYGEEGFNFSNPHIWKGLTSYRNGWLAYTPVMLLALAGIPFLWQQKSPWRWPLMIFLPLHLYLVYSWWCWNYVNGFGSRPMVESYALLAFPLAFFLSEMTKRRWTAWVTTGLLVFFTWLNLFNTWQFSKGLQWTENGNAAFFWRMLGKTSMDYFDLVTYESGEWQPDTASLRRSQVLHFNDFENPADTNMTTREAFSGSYSLYLTPAMNTGGKWSSSIQDLGLKSGDWVSVSVWANATGPAPSIEQGNVLDCKFMRNGKSKKSRKIRIESKLRNDETSIWGGNPGYWGKAQFWVKTPPFLHPDDTLLVRVRNMGGQPVYVDNLSVEIWEKK